MSYGENIRSIRIARGLTQQDLADKLGVTHGAVSSWERERTEPNMETVERMCEILSCKKSQIVGADNSRLERLSRYYLALNEAEQQQVDAFAEFLFKKGEKS